MPPKKCIHSDCTTRPAFNNVGQKVGLYCGTHKLTDMVDVVNKRCIHSDCTTRPAFNNVGQKVALYCSTHKLTDMVNVVSKTCIHPLCTKIAAFNLVGQKVALYCGTHKLTDMVDVKSKRCIHPLCTTRPTYNIVGQKVALYCNTHKLTDMVDVLNKTCIHPLCTTIPTYNIVGQKVALYCNTHKLTDMVDVLHKTCIHLECTTIPTYNHVGQKVALYCGTHKLTDMVDVLHKTCKSDWCNTQASNPQYDGYCCYCFTNLFPDHPHVRNYKNKENAVSTFVSESFPEYDWVFDKRVYDGCSKRRPDIMCDFGTHIVIVEVDENQHTDYESSCENRRTMELSQDFGHRPLVFVRFNPDGYTKNGQTQQSCWAINKATGLCAIPKPRMVNWNSRLRALQFCISSCMATIPDKTVTECRLYYDE
jgi:hypothetical protein